MQEEQDIPKLDIRQKNLLVCDLAIQGLGNIDMIESAYGLKRGDVERLLKDPKFKSSYRRAIAEVDSLKQKCKSDSEVSYRMMARLITPDVLSVVFSRMFDPNTPVKDCLAMLRDLQVYSGYNTPMDTVIGQGQQVILNINGVPNLPASIPEDSTVPRSRSHSHSPSIQDVDFKEISRKVIASGVSGASGTDGLKVKTPFSLPKAGDGERSMIERL